MAAPAFQALGTIVRSTGALTVNWPTPHQANDVALLFVETANQAPTLSTPAGFTQLAQDGNGTAGASGSTMLTVFWCRATSSNQASPVVADSGDHQTAAIITFRGCITTGNPFDVSATSNSAASTSISFPSVTTTVASTLIVYGLANGFDAAINQMTVTPVNANLTGITERADSQPIATGQVNNQLTYGSYGGMTDLVGLGPGNDNGAPFFTFMGINPFEDLANLGAQIDLADTLGVVLFVMVANDPSNYGVRTTNGFVLGASDPSNLATFDAAGTKSFCGQLKSLAAAADWLKLVDAFTRGRAVAYVGDEPYHAKWNNSAGAPTWTPVKVNQASRAIKTIVAASGGTVLTVIRGEPNKLRTGTSAGGWNNETIPTYDALDYGTMQYENAVANPGSAFDTALTNARTDANAINIGVMPTLNLWAGGIREDTDGVSALWDIENNGSSSGVIAGTAQPSGSIFANGQHVLAATWTSTPNAQRGTTVASPAWIRRCIDKVFNDPDVPWFGLWTYPRSSITQIWPWSDTLWRRSDFVAALDYAIEKAKTRTSQNIRTPKV